MQCVDIQTRDGMCPTWLHLPQGTGIWPAVILYMDGPGIRPALHRMARRLAEAGYAVLLPDLFYRSGAYEPVDPKVTFTDPVLRQAHREKYMAPVTPKAVMADTEALLAFMATRPDIKAGPVGVVGYCMGGRLALVTAATFPDRIVAAASYHGGGLANDTPGSPHLLAPRIKARVYVAGAIEDANFDDDQKQRLTQALAEAGVDHVVETRPARHGWVPDDMPVHDPAEAEHHWLTLLALFGRSFDKAA
ncbi:dienelactone hydrolase family protein [Niveispirillum cyanobacteriorum]|uniref:Dienelactone hydrolase n=1 Tax=Niveispirillum cyanobacteriorum TaxID=1612173 RepID=A0A2K9NHT8_9PROT|nr:dienelactone hydrolase family protein [Niveispirillum cyanobacteriorum]AUN32643.1 dienelactone hydrolase [Niveispirillum cyanobacteriorum]GGE82889.1 hydrolase [Niveispirillum cyanobacteriorum]